MYTTYTYVDMYKYLYQLEDKCTRFAFVFHDHETCLLRVVDVT